LLEAAITPIYPIRPRKILNVILGTIVGLMIGMGLSFFLEYLDRTIKTHEEVDRYLQLPVLATIPRVRQ
jgi:capsular polysaccharide biosynthesis protein